MAKATEAAIQAQLSTNINGPIIRASQNSAISTVESYYVTVNDPAYSKKAKWINTDPTDTAANIAAAIKAALV